MNHSFKSNLNTVNSVLADGEGRIGTDWDPITVYEHCIRHKSGAGER
ncbi:MAG: hypothetical protein ACI4S9_07475 [Christensenellales bacterium]